MMLELVKERHPALHADLLANLPSAKRIETALPVEWLPVQIDIDLMEALGRKLAPQVLDELVKQRQRLEMGSALFKTFIATIGRLLGLTPTQLLRHFPKGWGQVFQDCGKVELEHVEEGRGRIRIRKMPAACLESRVWIESLPVGVGMLYELVKVKTGKVSMTREGKDVVLHLSW